MCFGRVALQSAMYGGGHFVSGQSHGALSLAQYPACTAAEPGRESG